MRTMEAMTELNRPTKATGFASPALGYEAKTVDFNALLVKNAPATFFFRFSSSDMLSKGIAPNSLLIVDRSLKPRPRDLVLFAQDGRFFCREYHREKGKVFFTNGTTDIEANAETQIFGVVTYNLNPVRKGI